MYTSEPSPPTSSNNEAASFTTADYCVFGLLFLVSACIGIYFAFKDRKKKTSDNYLLAGRSLSGWPVALSLTSSFISAITFLGTPAENYMYGTMFWWYSVSYGVAALVTATVFLPVFYNLEVTSIYEYLENRFSKAVRTVCAIAFTVQTIIYMGMVMYMPALALNKVTGLSLYSSILVTSVVCTFYTAVGGLKAVIWNDVVQCVVMAIGLFAIIIQGSITVGGIDKVFQIAGENGRIDFFHFDLDPRVRHSVWSIWIGGSLTWLTVYGVNQSMVQRYLSCRSLKQAKLSLGLNYIGLLIVVCLACTAGLVMFAVYYNCDPLSSGKLSKSDQLVPYLVMDIFRGVPGFPGLVVAGAYSGTLSTVSTGINALACSTFEDFIKPRFPRISNSRSVMISKILVVVYGILGCGVAFFVSLLNEILTLALKLFGIIGGPVLGVFCLGFLTRIANSIGTVVGLCIGLVVGLWLGIGSVLCPPTSEFTKELPLSTDGCKIDYTTMSYDVMNSTTVKESLSNETTFCEKSVLANSLYALSYCHYSTFLVCVTCFTGILVSVFTGGLQSRSNVSPKLLAFQGKSCCCSNKNVTDDVDYIRETTDSEKNSLRLDDTF